MPAFPGTILRLWRGPKVGIAFSPGLVVARGAREEAKALQAEIPAGWVAPGTITPNIHSVSEVARVASQLVDELGGRGGEAALLVPDLSLVVALFPASRGLSGRDVELELTPKLGFPLAEARSDSWRGRKGEVLAAAVRKAVVHQYEQVVEAAECRLGWVDGASLVRLPEWVEASALEPEASLRLQLYRSHYVLALLRAGELLDLRTRLRSSDDGRAIVDEVLRLPAFYGFESLGAIRLSGHGAGACAGELREALGTETVFVEEEGEDRQLQSALGALLRRS